MNETLPHELLFDVYFLDYGDSQFISKKDILELRADFLSLRFQAIECFLAHIQPSENGSKLDEWDERAVEKFEELVQVAHWKKLISKVVAYKERKSFAFQRQSKQNVRESSPIPGVELYDPEENIDKNIALELVKMGYANMSDPFGDLSKSAILTVDPSTKTEKTQDIVEDIPEESTAEDVPEEVTAEVKAPELPDITQPTNETNNNLVTKTNGEAPKIPNDESNIFNAQKPPKPSKKHQTTDFLKNEQKASMPKTTQSNADWNAMMEE